MSEPSVNQQSDIEAALIATLPATFHPDIPVLAHVLTAARDGSAASVATENLQAALLVLQGKTLNVQSGNITVGNVIGEGIAIGHGAQATVIRIYVPRTAEQKQAWRNRSRMLEKVRTYWIEGFLKQSLHKVALIDLGMQYHPDALEHPWEMFVQSPDRPRTSVPPGTTIADVFDHFGGDLLILGSPGTGKTTMLLELTRTLIERAQQDETHAIPVVFNLSSWAVKCPPLDNWLVEELHARYDVPRKLAKAWIENDHVLPLLDGLDEVSAAQRINCVETINAFRDEHGLMGMAVCSRIADYEVLTQKLRLQGAVLLQTLTERQIEDALRQIGDTAETVRTVLKQLQDNARAYDDHDAQALMHTPLLLSITALAYQGNAAGKLPPRDVPPVVQQRHLFATYVERMFTRRGQSTRYTPGQTTQWLSWLARSLVQHEQTTFYLELMQPTWLPATQWQRFDTWTGLFRGALVGIAVGSIGMPLILLILRIVGLVPALWLDSDLRSTSGTVLVSAAVCGVIFGTIGVVAARRGECPETIGLIEKLDWSAQAMRSAVVFGLGVGLPVTLILLLAYGWSGALAGIATGIALWALLLGRDLRIASQQVIRSVPNQGVWQSATYALLLSLKAGVSVGLSTGLILGLVVDPAFGSVFGLALGIGVGIFAALFFGWETFFKHFLLRGLLLRQKVIPQPYVPFLDYAAERIFLRKVGGGYIFVHRMLMDYFANLESGRQHPRQGSSGETST